MGEPKIPPQVQMTGIGDYVGMLNGIDGGLVHPGVQGRDIQIMNGFLTLTLIMNK